MQVHVWHGECTMDLHQLGSAVFSLAEDMSGCLELVHDLGCVQTAPIDLSVLLTF